MQLHTLTQALHIVGIELRTTNEEAQLSIPGHWARFSQSNLLSSFPQRLSDDVFAVYTHFENAGVNNQGLYSLVIGARVAADAAVPPNMVRVVVPASPRAVFEVKDGKTDQVVNTWKTIWERNDLPKSFIAEYEQYGAGESIQISIGLQGSAASA